jgi:hypothetical protein
MNQVHIMRTTLVNEVMRLASLFATARVRHHVVNAGLNGNSAETKEGVQKRVIKAENELRGYANGLALLSENNEVAKALMRKQELIADIGFEVGHWWERTTNSGCSKIMEHCDGSRGLMQLVVEWAGEFDTFWEALDEDDDRRENYIEEIVNFTAKKIAALALDAGVDSK